MRILLPLFSLFCSLHSLEVMTSMPLNDTKTILSVLDTLPKECEKNGKKYKEGENFESGSLRYKCQKYGVYSIEGCKSEKEGPLEIGQSLVKDNVLYQCLKSGYSVYYRETTCGTMGMPDCDKVAKPGKFLKAEQNKPTAPKGRKIDMAGLPEGWQLFEEGAKKIPNTNATLVSRTLIFSGVHSRARRQQGHGIGRVVGIEDPGTDKPPMPMEMLMGGTKVTKTPMKAMVGAPKAETSSKKDFTQELGAKLNIGNPKSHSFKPETVGGSRSDVGWKGKTAILKGKPIAVGPGTFTFGNHPTSSFVGSKKATPVL